MPLRARPGGIAPITTMFVVYCSWEQIKSGHSTGRGPEGKGKSGESALGAIAQAAMLLCQAVLPGVVAATTFWPESRGQRDSERPASLATPSGSGGEERVERIGVFALVLTRAGDGGHADCSRRPRNAAGWTV